MVNSLKVDELIYHWWKVEMAGEKQFPFILVITGNYRQKHLGMFYWGWYQDSLIINKKLSSKNVNKTRRAQNGRLKTNSWENWNKKMFWTSPEASLENLLSIQLKMFLIPYQNRKYEFKFSQFWDLSEGKHHTQTTNKKPNVSEMMSFAFHYSGKWIAFIHTHSSTQTNHNIGDWIKIKICINYSSIHKLFDFTTCRMPHTMLIPDLFSFDFEISSNTWPSWHAVEVLGSWHWQSKEFFGDFHFHVPAEKNWGTFSFLMIFIFCFGEIQPFFRLLLNLEENNTGKIAFASISNWNFRTWKLMLTFLSNFLKLKMLEFSFPESLKFNAASPPFSHMRMRWEQNGMETS